MIPYERREQLLAYLSNHQNATIRELTKTLYVSEASVRRDLVLLEQEGLIRRTWGGVILNQNQKGVVPLSLRDGDHAAAKEAIARRAAELVHDGDIIMMDASSTVRRMMRYLADRKDLTVITNNLRILNECEAPGIRIYSTGGLYNRKNHALVGSHAIETVRRLSADVCFFSSQGMTEEGEITDASEEETALRRAMLGRCRQQYFLCDESKVGKRYLFTLCHRDDLTDVVSNTENPTKAKQELDKNRAEIGQKQTKSQIQERR